MSKNSFKKEIKNMNTSNRDTPVSVKNGVKGLIFSICFILCLSGKAFSTWPEFPLSTGCFSGSAYGNQISPSIAFNGTNYLVVWDDERINTDKDIFGTIVSPQGEILDPIGISICTAPNLQTDVKVAGGNENYLVVWGDYRNGNYDIYGARVDFAGNVLDPNGFPISMGSWWESFPDVAWDGVNFLVVWSDDRNSNSSYDIYGTRVTPSGEVLDPGGIQISNELGMAITPAISYNGSIYFVAWELAGG